MDPEAIDDSQGRASVKPDRLRLLAMPCAVLTALFAQSLSAGGEAPSTEAVVEILVALLLVFLIIFVPFLLYNTLVAWLASKIISFKDATVGKAFKLSLLQLLMPIPLGIALSVGLFFVLKETAPAEEGSVSRHVIISVICFFIFVWLLCVFIASKVYKVGFLSAAVFNVLLFVVHGVLSFVLGVGNLLMEQASKYGGGA